MAAQKDNSDMRAKVILRQWLIEEMGGIEKLNVLELYAGFGHCFDACYQGCYSHLAFEKRKVDREGWLMGNNRKLLPDHVDGWDIYDGDAYDNPWIILTDVCRLRQPGRFALLATCGIGRGLKNGKTNGFIRQITGTNGLSDTRLLFRWYDDVIRLVMVRWATYGCQIESIRRIQNKNNADVWYYAVIINKTT